MKIVLFGGSFDPVHRGHVAVADAVQAALKPERLLWLPARQAPHKPDQSPAGDADRCALLELALAGRANEQIDARELQRPGPSYTVDTVAEIAAENPGAELWLVVGADMLDQLHQWKDVERLLQLTRVLVAPRPRFGPERLDNLRRRLPGEVGPRLRARMLPMKPVAASSTEVRERIRKGESCAELLPPGVEDALRKRGLYCSPA